MDAKEIVKRYRSGERDFREADLTRANLHGANLSGASVDKGLGRAKSLRGATMPDRTTYE